MTCTDQQLRAITFLVCQVRQVTYGANAWDEDGTMAALRKLAAWPLAALVEHAVGHAADPKAKTPGVFQSAFTPKTQQASPVDPHRRPPTRSEECPVHAGQYAVKCGGCAADAAAGDGRPEAGKRGGPTAAYLAAKAQTFGATETLEAD